MATNTTHYNLKKPAGTEDINVNDINSNMDVIDTALWNLPAAYKGTLSSGTSVDSISDGIYYMTNSLPVGIPSECQWCFLYQISNAAIIQQIIVRPAGGIVYAREHSGSPSAWTGWHCICGHSAVTRITYGSYSYVEYWRNGQCGCLKMYYNVSDGTIAAWTTKTIATLPSGFRPATTVLQRGIVDRAGDEGTAFLVDADGVVKVSTRHNPFSTGGDVLQGTLTFPIRY